MAPVAGIVSAKTGAKDGGQGEAWAWAIVEAPLPVKTPMSPPKLRFPAAAAFSVVVRQRGQQHGRAGRAEVKQQGVEAFLAAVASEMRRCWAEAEGWA